MCTKIPFSFVFTCMERIFNILFVCIIILLRILFRFSFCILTIVVVVLLLPYLFSIYAYYLTESHSIYICCGNRCGDTVSLKTTILYYHNITSPQCRVRFVIVRPVVVACVPRRRRRRRRHSVTLTVIVFNSIEYSN